MKLNNRKILKIAMNKVILRLFEDFFILPQSSQLKSLPTFSGIHKINMQLALNRRLVSIHDSMLFIRTVQQDKKALNSLRYYLKELWKHLEINQHKLEMQPLN